MRWAAAFLVAALAGAAMAQTENTSGANPVLVHYRDYRAALERNDLAAAETAAEAALAASEARDGDGGRTAILAMNLAHARLERGGAAEALQPARRAYDLATARGAQSGVDPIIASLALGRAELASDGRAGERRLLAALTEAQTRGDIHADAYLAANALSTWGFEHEKWETARISAVAIGRHAEGAAFGAPFGRAEARLAEGAALVLMRRRDAEAYAALTEAHDLFRPFAEILSPNGEMTVAQSRYAQAMAWRSALGARMSADRVRLPDESDREDLVEGAPTPLSPPCDMRLIPRPLPNYPREALNRLGVGAVVLRVRIDANGEILDRQIAAVVLTSGGFRESVARVMDQWRAERHSDSAPNCRMDMTTYVPIRFVVSQ